jgi:hypothetical protein
VRLASSIKRGNQAAPGKMHAAFRRALTTFCSRGTKMAKMILSHNLLVVHCTLECLFRECVTILVTTLSHFFRVHNRPKSFNYPSKLLNPQYYGSTLLFPKMGFFVLLCNQKMLLGRSFLMHPLMEQEHFRMDMGKVLRIIVCFAACVRHTLFVAPLQRRLLSIWFQD